MKKIISIIAFGFLMILNSCEKTIDPSATSAVKMANEWWVTLDKASVQDIFGIGHFKITTYNTAENNNLLWIDDDSTGYGIKAKVTADYKNLTFSGSQAVNAFYDPARPSRFPQTANITDGKILVKMGHSKSGQITDSIHMKIEFSDDPGTIYEMNGVARTRFSEDDY